MPNHHGEPAITDGLALTEKRLLSLDARKIVRSFAPEDFAKLPETLLNGDLISDALKVTPFVLPLRDAVWWGCLCAWHASNRKTSGVQHDLIETVVRWVIEPSRPQLQEVGGAWRADRLRTPGGCCARAAELAGRLSDDQTTLKPRNAFGAAKTLVAASQMALVAAHRNAVAVSETQLVLFGLDVATGRATWEQPETIVP
ncbi:hypothetical protein Pan216_14950 [Planctomycetes bacterium Pan216]|uniref:Uncharacterized protein n=1 Tax=Kolteria novifilia TaxID=2527975 RepID=A0A518B0Z5_9BACT|nr:hypothetical protein Pan216_14950 [Planctomycetes bacterium Pan216]